MSRLNADGLIPYRSLTLPERSLLGMHIAVNAISGDDSQFPADGSFPRQKINHGAEDTRILVRIDFDGMTPEEIYDLRVHIANYADAGHIVAQDYTQHGFREAMYVQNLAAVLSVLSHEGEHSDEMRQIGRVVSIRNDAEFIGEVKQILANSITYEIAEAKGIPALKAFGGSVFDVAGFATGSIDRTIASTIAFVGYGYYEGGWRSAIEELPVLGRLAIAAREFGDTEEEYLGQLEPGTEYSLGPPERIIKL